MKHKSYSEPGLGARPLRRQAWAGLLAGALGCLALACAHRSPLLAPEAFSPVHADLAYDRDGVPHVEAADQRSLWVGLGYAHARARLWQLHYWRALAEGHLSDYTGNSALQSDGFFHMLNLEGHARADWHALPEGSGFRRRVEAYTEGVNRYIREVQDGRHALPREFELVGARPTRWDPWCTFEVIYLQGLNLDLDLGASTRAKWVEAHGRADEVRRRWELGRHDLDYLTLGAQRGPTAPEWLKSSGGASALRANAEQGSGQARGSTKLPLTMAAALQIPEEDPAGWQPRLPLAGRGASNVFAIGGARTASGLPIVGNDTHLHLEAPGIWYAVALEVPDTLHCAGFTVPGVPILISGRNRDVAWGVTALGANVVRVYAESLDASGSHYLQGTQWVPVRSMPLELSYRLGPLRLPLFWIKGGQTLRGPILREDRKHHKALSVSWYALGMRGIRHDAVQPELARSADELIRALQSVACPTLNVIAADRHGALRYSAIGVVPRLPQPLDPLPSPGWLAESAWPDSIPATEMPAGDAAQQGYLVNCNNRPGPRDYRYQFGNYYRDYRARRLDELVSGARSWTAQDAQRTQTDSYSPQVERFLPLLLARTDRVALSAGASRARELLRGYHGVPAPDSPVATLYRSWAVKTRARLGVAVLDGFVELVLRGKDPGGNLADSTVGTALDRLVAGTLEDAVRGLTKQFGPMGSKWNWRESHRAHFEHPLESRDSSLSPPLIPVPGDVHSVNVADCAPPERPNVDHGPSMRHVSDLSDSAGMWFIMPPGNSGDVRSPHYQDHLKDWAEGRYRRLVLGRPPKEDVEELVELR